MKIRNGFVSNSSSSSFLIYGAKVSKDNITEEMFNKLNLTDEYCKTFDDFKKLGKSEIAEIVANKIGLNCYYGYDDKYIGNSWSNVGDDQTGRQFKDSIQEKLNLINKKASTLEEAYYDG